MGEKISVGEMAKLFGVGVQTLHHYEQKGIFMPYSRNQENNYREYIFEQRFQLAD